MELSKPFTTNQRIILVLAYGLATAEVVVTALQRRFPFIILATFFVLSMLLRERKPNPRWQRWAGPPAAVIVICITVQTIVWALK